jgi:hypothetical protein
LRNTLQYLKKKRLGWSNWKIDCHKQKDKLWQK